MISVNNLYYKLWCSLQNGPIAGLAALQMPAHGIARTVLVTVEYGLYDLRVFPMQMGDIITGTGVCARLKCCTGNDATADHCQKLAEAGIVGGICNGKMQGKICLARGLPGFEAGQNLPVTIDDGFFLLGRTTQGGKARCLDFHAGAQFQKFYDGRNALIIKVLEGNCFRRLRLEHKDPRTLPCFHQPVSPQGCDRFANDRATASLGNFVPGVISPACMDRRSCSLTLATRFPVERDVSLSLFVTANFPWLCFNRVAILIMQNKTAYESRMTY